jgi:hypothetical protein
MIDLFVLSLISSNSSKAQGVLRWKRSARVTPLPLGRLELFLNPSRRHPLPSSSHPRCRRRGRRRSGWPLRQWRRGSFAWIRPRAPVLGEGRRTTATAVPPRSRAARPGGLACCGLDGSRMAGSGLLRLLPTFSSWTLDMMSLAPHRPAMSLSLHLLIRSAQSLGDGRFVRLLVEATREVEGGDGGGSRGLGERRSARGGDNGDGLWRRRPWPWI